LTRGTILVVGAGVGELVVGTGVGELVVGTGVGELVVGAGVGEVVVGAGVGEVVVGAGVGERVVGTGVGIGVVGGIAGIAGATTGAAVVPAGAVGSVGVEGSAGLVGWVLGSVGATIDRELLASSSLPAKTMATGATTAMTTKIRASKIYILLVGVPLTSGVASSFVSSSNRTFLTESFFSRSRSSALLEPSEAWVAGVPTLTSVVDGPLEPSEAWVVGVPTLTSVVDGVEGGEDSSSGKDVSSSSGSGVMVGYSVLIFVVRWSADLE
jgi:hypothetical protein